MNHYNNYLDLDTYALDLAINCYVTLVRIQSCRGAHKSPGCSGWALPQTNYLGTVPINSSYMHHTKHCHFFIYIYVEFMPKIITMVGVGIGLCFSGSALDLMKNRIHSLHRRNINFLPYVGPTVLIQQLQYPADHLT